MKVEPGTLKQEISNQEESVDQLMNGIESMVIHFRELAKFSGKRITIYPGDREYELVRKANMNVYGIKDWYMEYLTKNEVFQQKPANMMYSPGGAMVSPVEAGVIPFVFEVLVID